MDIEKKESKSSIINAAAALGRRFRGKHYEWDSKTDKGHEITVEGTIFIANDFNLTIEADNGDVFTCYWSGGTFLDKKVTEQA